jgi:retron-type reverse transcriptase
MGENQEISRFIIKIGNKTLIYKVLLFIIHWIHFFDFFIPKKLNIFDASVRTGVIEEGKYYEVDKGTPQGGILSPLLANIYLHYCLDIWFEKRVRRQMRGYARLIRYADDFVVCFQKAEEAEVFRRVLRERLGKFGLMVSEEKSRIIAFGRYSYYTAREQGQGTLG